MNNVVIAAEAHSLGGCRSNLVLACRLLLLQLLLLLLFLLTSTDVTYELNLQN